MATDINRRQAFQRVVHLYPDILRRVVDEDECTLFDPKTEKHQVEMTYDQKHNVKLVFMAQFFTRLVVTRCHNAGPAMLEFSEKTKARYDDYRTRLLDGLDIYCDEKIRQAVLAYENGIAETIFSALATEAEIIEQTAATAPANSPDFSEPDFWKDVMLAFGGLHRKGDPRWVLAAQEIFLDHRAEFTAALDAETQLVQ